ncbi:hypothetical protein KY328_00340, partial [Candidatus Woesearchaeota archaeon]|nr:hypothetical protein [Candidatus Woesearchaeota archaeon]
MGDFEESVNTEEVANPQTTGKDNLDIDTSNNMDDESFWVDETDEAETPDVADTDDEESTKTPDAQKQTDEDNAKFADMRRKQELEKERQVAKELKARQDNIAISLGYASFDDMETAVKAQKYVDQGYDDEIAKKLVNLESYEQELQQKLNSARITEEKSKLKDAPYFKDFEKEVDEILEHNPNLSVELVFHEVTGANTDNIFEKSQSAAR